MSKVSRESAPDVKDFGVALDRGANADGYTMCFTTIRDDSDLAPMLVGLPDDACQCPHWGYLFSGQITVTYKDRVETIEAGDAFVMTPGHTPKATAGSEFIMFSPEDELAVTEAAIAANAQRMAQAT